MESNKGVKGAVQEVHIHNYANSNSDPNNIEEAKNQSSAGIDLSIPYSLSSSASFMFDSSEVSKQSELLQKHRIMVLTGDDFVLRKDALRGLLECIPNHECLSLRAFDKESIKMRLADKGQLPEANDDSTGFSVAKFDESRRDIPGNSLIISDLPSSSSSGEYMEFLSQIGNERYHADYFARMSENLIERNQYWLILAPAHRSDQQPIQQNIGKSIDVWYPDYLNSILKKVAGNETLDYGDLKLQVAKELWGEPNEHLQILRRAAENNSFEYEYRIRKEKIHKQIEEENRYLPLLQGTEPAQGLFQAILFVMCHYPKLSQSAFTQVLRALTRDINFTVYRDIHESVIHNTPTVNLASGGEPGESIKVEIDGLKIEKTTSGNVVQQPTSLYSDKVRKTEETHYGAMEYWTSWTGEICKKCGITTDVTHGSDDQGQYVIFKNPWYKTQARNALRDHNPFYFSEQFRVIRHSDLLFSQDDIIAIATSQIIKAKMLEEPDTYDANWLTEYLLIIHHNIDNGHYEGEPSFESAVVLLAKKGILLYRWTGLLMVLLQEDKLQHVVDEFLHKLLRLSASSQNDEIVQILLEFIRRMRSQTKFNSVYWLEKVITEFRDIKIRRRAEGMLTSYFRYQLTPQPKIIKQLEHWLNATPTNEGIIALKQIAYRIPIKLCCTPFDRYLTETLEANESMFPIFESIEDLENFEFTESLLDMVANDFAGEADVPMTNYIGAILTAVYGNIEIGSAEGECASLPVFVTELILEEGSHKENIVCALMIGWSFILRLNGSDEAKACLEHLCSLIQVRLNKVEIKRLRSYLKAIDQLTKNLRKLIPAKEYQMRLREINGAIVEVRNILYRFQRPT